MASCVLLCAVAWTACDSDSPAGPTPPPAPVEVPLTATARGSVRSDGIVDTDATVGDGAVDRAHQAFLAFDLSSIPAGSRIDAVRVDFASATIIGDPFEWGCVVGYAVTVFPLDSGDYAPGEPPASDRLFEWCTAAALNAGTTIGDRLLTTLRNRARLELRLYTPHKLFQGARSDSDGDPDQVRFGTPRLVVTYTAQ